MGDRDGAKPEVKALADSAVSRCGKLDVIHAGACGASDEAAFTSGVWIEVAGARRA